MLSSRSFATSYHTLMQTYYFHRFYQCIETVLFKVTILTYAVGLPLGFIFLALSPFFMQLLLPVNLADSYVSSLMTETKTGLLFYYCRITIRKAAIAGIILLGLDMVFYRSASSRNICTELCYLFNSPSCWVSFCAYRGARKPGRFNT